MASPKSSKRNSIYQVAIATRGNSRSPSLNRLSQGSHELITFNGSPSKQNYSNAESRDFGSFRSSISKEGSFIDKYKMSKPNSVNSHASKQNANSRNPSSQPSRRNSDGHVSLVSKPDSFKSPKTQYENFQTSKSKDPKSIEKGNISKRSSFVSQASKQGSFQVVTPTRPSQQPSRRTSGGHDNMSRNISSQPSRRHSEANGPCGSQPDCVRPSQTLLDGMSCPRSSCQGGSCSKTRNSHSLHRPRSGSVGGRCCCCPDPPEPRLRDCYPSLYLWYPYVLMCAAVYLAALVALATWDDARICFTPLFDGEQSPCR